MLSFQVGAFSPQALNQYRGSDDCGGLPPHLFAIVSGAYRNVIRSSLDQSIIVSGESGSGKTETAKAVLAL